MITNKRIKEIGMMNQKSRARREEHAFLAEGIKMFLEAPTDRIREIYVSESFFAEGICRDKLEKCGYERVSDEIFKKITDTMTPQGIVCVIEREEYTLADMLTKEAPLIMVLEELQDPGNLGTIIRTGEGAGINGVIMSKGCVDIYNPKTIRSTMGSVYRIPFLYVDDLRQTMTELKASGVSLYAAHLKGEKYYDEISYWKQNRGCAFLIGNEGNGLTQETAGQADTYLKIPMEGQVESLNAAIAGSLLMYEAYRQYRNRIK